MSRRADRHDLVTAATQIRVGMSIFFISALKSVSEKPCAIEDVLDTRLHALEPDCAPQALRTRSGRWALQKGGAAGAHCRKERSDP
jgi:hypothetical protein